MRHPPDMPELEKDRAALGVYGIDDFPPSFDLLLGIDAGYAGAAETGYHHGRSFSDDEPTRRRALGVIFRVHGPGRQTRLRRPHPRQRRHRKAMFELVGTDLER